MTHSDQVISGEAGYSNKSMDSSQQPGNNISKDGETKWKTVSYASDKPVLRCNEYNLIEFIGDYPCDDSFVRTHECMPSSLPSSQFEVEIVNCKDADNSIVVGLSTNDADRCPGMTLNTIGIYGSDGSICQDGLEMAVGDSYSKGDLISCQVIRKKDGSLIRTFCQFWKNGAKNGPSLYLYGIECRMAKMFPRQIFPAVGIGTPGAVVWVNLGENPFRFSLEHADLMDNESPSTLTVPLHEVFIKVPKSDHSCILPGCQYDTLVCGTFNHLVYHQKPHHGLRHSTAREIYQEWIKHHYTISTNPKNIDLEPKEWTNSMLVTSQITSVKSSDTKSNNTETCDVNTANDTTLKPLQNDPISKQSKVQEKEKISDDNKYRNESAVPQEELLHNENADTNESRLLQLHSQGKESVLRIRDHNIVEFCDSKCDEHCQSFVRTSSSIPKGAPSFYFEVTIINGGEDNNISVGLCTSQANMCPGMNANTIGIYGTDGSIRQNGEKIGWGGSFTNGDIISCQITRMKDWKLRLVPTRCQFWKNGQHSGPTRYLAGRKLYPAVGLNTPGAIVCINIGDQPFRYGFDRQTYDSKNKDNSTFTDNSPSDKLKTLWQLTDMGFKMEDSKRAMQILKCTDLHTLMDYLFSLSLTSDTETEPTTSGPVIPKYQKRSSVNLITTTSSLLGSGEDMTLTSDTKEDTATSMPTLLKHYL